MHPNKDTANLRAATPAHNVPGVADLGAVVANNVRAERARRKWRQEDLADRLGWSRGSIGHLESGRRRPSVADLPQLCRVFDISMAELFNGADPADLEALGL
jgi:transcriptional regulator with XRE-family HTH domain